MSDYSELKRLAEHHLSLGQAYTVAKPSVLLALIADNERLTAAIGSQAIRRFVGQDDQKKMDELVSAGIQVDKDRIAQLEAERDQLKAENKALRREREGKVLCDLDLFETLRDAANTEADEHRQCMATYRPLRQANLDSVVKKCDGLLAAMGNGEQS